MTISNLKRIWQAIDHADVWKRTAKTFVVAFLAVFSTSASDFLNAFKTGGLSAVQALGVSLALSGIAAGLTAAWNYGLQAWANK